MIFKKAANFLFKRLPKDKVEPSSSPFSTIYTKGWAIGPLDRDPPLELGFVLCAAKKAKEQEGEWFLKIYLNNIRHPYDRNSEIKIIDLYNPACMPAIIYAYEKFQQIAIDSLTQSKLYSEHGTRFALRQEENGVNCDATFRPLAVIHSEINLKVPKQRERFGNSSNLRSERDLLYADAPRDAHRRIHNLNWKISSSLKNLVPRFQELSEQGKYLEPPSNPGESYNLRFKTDVASKIRYAKVLNSPSP